MRLIDADAFVEDIKTEIMNLYLDGMKGTPRPRSELYDIIDRIGEQPTINPEDCKPHGRWISDEGDVLFHCSECETQISTSWDYDDLNWNYCPNCGAKMDGKENNNA